MIEWRDFGVEVVSLIKEKLEEGERQGAPSRNKRGANWRQKISETQDLLRGFQKKSNL